jgi:hypothetical protein
MGVNMKKYGMFCFVLWMLVAALTVGSGFAADSLNFTESYGQKVPCEKYCYNYDEGYKGYGGGGDCYYYCDVEDSGKFKIVAKVSLAGIDIKNQLNKSTSFAIQFSDFSSQNVLGDDKNYTSGKTSAKFLYYDTYYDSTVCYLKISLKWNSKQLTVTVEGKTPDWGVNPILANDYLGEESGPINNSAIAKVNFSTLQALFDVSITGKVTTKTVVKHGEEFEVSNISLKGKGTPK